MLLLSESVRARTAGSARGGHRWLMMSLPLSERKPERGRRTSRGNIVRGTGHRDYTVPSLSWVVAMAHRDYIVHRGIYSRCRRRFLPTRRFLIAGDSPVWLTSRSILLSSRFFPPAFEKSPSTSVAFVCGCAFDKDRRRIREKGQKKERDAKMKGKFSSKNLT